MKVTIRQRASTLSCTMLCHCIESRRKTDGNVNVSNFPTTTPNKKVSTSYESRTQALDIKVGACCQQLSVTPSKCVEVSHTGRSKSIVPKYDAHSEFGFHVACGAAFAWNQTCPCTAQVSIFSQSAKDLFFLSMREESRSRVSGRTAKRLGR